ncbi:MAG: hypothetical protein SFX18_08895 [Pirellulales bacterium]|nr:hypothetical protein [Pirellulales bacterium]
MAFFLAGAGLAIFPAGFLTAAFLAAADFNAADFTAEPCAGAAFLAATLEGTLVAAGFLTAAGLLNFLAPFLAGLATLAAACGLTGPFLAVVGELGLAAGWLFLLAAGFELPAVPGTGGINRVVKGDAVAATPGVGMGKATPGS